MAVVAPLPDPSPDTWGKRFNSYGALVVTIFIFGLFYLGLILSAKYADLPAPASNLLETVKALAMIAAGFWLGSSMSSQKKDDANTATTTAAMAAIAGAPAPVTTTITTPPPPGSGGTAPTTVTTTQPAAIDPTAAAQAALAANPVPHA